MAGAGGFSSGRGQGPDGPGGPNKPDKPVDSGSSSEGNQVSGLASQGLNKAAEVTGQAGFSAMALMVNAARGGSRAVRSVFMKIAAIAMKMGGGLSSVTGGLVSAKVGALLMTVLLGGTGAGIGALGLSALLGSPASREGLLDDCERLSQSDQEKYQGSSGSSEDQEKAAQKVYSALSYAGMGDENIAGILGNMQTESGIDPTSVETIFDEPFKIGPRKKDAESRDFKPDGRNVGVSQTVQKLGIGLAQWTNERNTMLTKYAKQKGKDWFEIEVQLAFMMSEDNSADVKVLQTMIANKNQGADNPAKAADYFLKQWERPANNNQPIRGQQAGEWYAKMKSWGKDTAFGESVLALAEQEKGVANGAQTSSDIAKCPGKSASNGGGNASLAEAAVTYAWPFYKEAANNDGTDMYRWLHDQIYPGDAYYASCDRSVAVAVRWSGSDDNYPAGATGPQASYLEGEGKDKWEHVGTFPAVEKELKPGDILIASGTHTLMYVGKDAVKATWPNDKDHEPDAEYMQGSLNDHSPGLMARSGVASTFEVYRNKSKEKSSKYSSLRPPSGMEPGVGDKSVFRTPGP